MKLLDRLRWWIVRKLGGINFSYLPEEVQRKALEIWAKEALDKQMVDILNSGFETHYVNDRNAQS